MKSREKYGKTVKNMEKSEKYERREKQGNPRKSKEKRKNVEMLYVKKLEWRERY